MPDRLAEIADPAPTGAASMGVLTQERPSSTISAALTVDPGAAGTTFTFTSTAIFTREFGVGTFKAKVENEVVLAVVASGTTLTVTRAQDGTTGATHAIGKFVAALAAAQIVVPISPRSVTFCGSTAAWRTLGNAASGQNLFTIENQAGSAVILGVSRLTLEMDLTVANLAVGLDIVTFRPTALPSGGTVLTKHAIDSALVSASTVVARGATASHGGAATAITATAPATNPVWHQFSQRISTAVGTGPEPTDFSMLPTDIADVDWVAVRAGESLGVQVVGTAATNAATNHYVVKCAWFEYTIP